MACGERQVLARFLMQVTNSGTANGRGRERIELCRTVSCIAFSVNGVIGSSIAFACSQTATRYMTTSQHHQEASNFGLIHSIVVRFRPTGPAIYSSINERALFSLPEYRFLPDRLCSRIPLLFSIRHEVCKTFKSAVTRTRQQLVQSALADLESFTP